MVINVVISIPLGYIRMKNGADLITFISGIVSIPFFLAAFFLKKEIAKSDRERSVNQQTVNYAA